MAPTRPATPRKTTARALVAALLLATAASAGAETPEVVVGLGPGNGDWLLKYEGQLGNANGSDEPRRHSGSSFYGVTDWLAIGGETMLGYRSGPRVPEDRLYFDYDSAIAILRFSDARDDPVGVGLWLQASLDSDGEVARLEARMIAEKRTPTWWAEGNVMFRRVNEEEKEGAYAAYSARIGRAVAPGTWLGLETSGQGFRLSGFSREPLDRSRYAGVNLRQEVPLGGDDSVTLGASLLHRIDGGPGPGRGEGIRNLVQLVGELRF
jgi:hypothetical protein